jgi:hypothetical protein
LRRAFLQRLRLTAALEHRRGFEEFSREIRFGFARRIQKSQLLLGGVDDG